MEMEVRRRKVRPETPAPDHVNCPCSVNAVWVGTPNVEGILYHPVRILKNNQATVVFWKDGTKTVVKCAPGTTPNDYDAFTAALAIKVFGNNSALKKVIQRSTVVQAPKPKKKGALNDERTEDVNG